MRGHSLPHGWGRGTRHGDIVGGKRRFPLDDASEAVGSVTNVSRVRSLIPIQKSRPARRLFYLSGAVRPNHLLLKLTFPPTLIWPCRTISGPQPRTGRSILINFGQIVQAELLVEHARQDALKILAGRGLQHPDAALEVARQIGADMHPALSARRHHARFSRGRSTAPFRPRSAGGSPGGRCLL